MSREYLSWLRNVYVCVCIGKFSFKKVSVDKLPVGAMAVGETTSFVQNPGAWVHDKDSAYYVEYVHQNHFFLSNPDLPKDFVESQKKI